MIYTHIMDIRLVNKTLFSDYSFNGQFSAQYFSIYFWRSSVN